MNDTSSDTRIPIEEFEDFATCQLVGQQFGMRYQAFCEAFTASMADPVRKLERTPWPRQCTNGLRGREPHASYGYDNDFNLTVRVVEALPVPGGAIGESNLNWYGKLA